VEAKAAALAKKNGFASLAQYDDVSTNITMIIATFLESQFFALVGRHPETGGRNREGRMLANVFSNTTPPRVEKAEGVPLLGLALSLCVMAPPVSPARGAVPR
jgi:hypothetical protein